MDSSFDRSKLEKGIDPTETVELRGSKEFRQVTLSYWDPEVLKHPQTNI